MTWLVNVSADAAAKTETSSVLRITARSLTLELLGRESNAGAHLEALVAGIITLVSKKPSTLSKAMQEVVSRRGRTSAMSRPRRDNRACPHW